MPAGRGVSSGVSQRPRAAITTGVSEGKDELELGDEAPESEGELGRGTGKQGEWARDDEDARAAKQQGDVHALDVEGDPRGGVQSDEYRTADPREVVSEGDVVMSGPGGAPQEGKTVEERRAESGARRAAHSGPGISEDSA